MYASYPPLLKGLGGQTYYCDGLVVVPRVDGRKHSFCERYNPQSPAFKVMISYVDAAMRNVQVLRP